MTARHVHPLTLLFNWGRSLRDNWVLLLLMLLQINWITARWWALLLAGLYIAGVVLLPVVRYVTFTYALEDDMIVVHSGIFERKHTHIPYARIQTIQQKQAWYMRPFHLMALIIETAGHQEDEPEAELNAVPVAVYDELTAKQQASRQRGSSPAAVPADQVSAPADPAELKRSALPAAPDEGPTTAPTLDSIAAMLAEPDRPATVGGEAHYKINGRDLNLYALTSLSLFPFLIAVVLGYPKIAAEIPARFTAQVSRGVASALLILAGVLIGMLVLLALITYLRLLVRFYGFTITRTGDDITTQRGLLSRNTVTTKVQRIQAVRLSQSILRRLFHLTTIQALLASRAAEDESDDELVLLPVSRTATWQQVKALTGYGTGAAPEWQRPPRRTQWYQLRNAFLLSLVPTIPLMIWLRPWGYGALLLPLAAIWQGWYAGAHRGVSIDRQRDELYALHGRWFTQATLIADHQQIQSVALHQSIWMRSRHLAHLEINVRRGNSNDEFAIRYLPEDVAANVYQWFTEEQRIHVVSATVPAA